MDLWGGAAPIRSRHWRDIGIVHLWVVAMALIAQMLVFAVLPLAPALIKISSEMAGTGVGGEHVPWPRRHVGEECQHRPVGIVGACGFPMVILSAV